MQLASSTSDLPPTSRAGPQRLFLNFVHSGGFQALDLEGFFPNFRTRAKWRTCFYGCF